MKDYDSIFFDLEGTLWTDDRFSTDDIAATVKAVSKHYPLSIISNCSLPYLEHFLDVSQLRPYFKDYECIGRTNQPKSQNIKNVMQRSQFKKPLYVGDTSADQRACLDAGVDFLYVEWGHGVVCLNCDSIKKPKELLSYLEL